MAKKLTTIFKKKNYKSDILYNSMWFTKLIKILMVNGKKKTIQKYIYSSFFFFKKEKNLKSFFLFIEFLDLLKPLFRIINIRRGRNFYPIPIPINLHKQFNYSIKIFKIGLLKKPESNLILKLNSEIDFLLKNRIDLNKVKNKTQEDMTYNRGFLHFR
jgi:ribosomal protein S7